MFDLFNEDSEESKNLMLYALLLGSLNINKF